MAQYKTNAFLFNSSTDLGNYLKQSNSISFSPNETTQNVKTVVFPNPVRINSADIQVRLDGVSKTGETFTFGPSIPSFMIAGGSGGNTMAYSTDGVTWNKLNYNLASSLNGVCWNGRIWVAGGMGPVAVYSTDGFSWTACSGFIPSTTVDCLAWSGTTNTWLMTGLGGNTVAFSYDGINWNGSTSGKNTFPTECYNVAWNGTMWVGAGKGAGNTLAYSYDGLTWVGSGNTMFSISGYNVAWSGNKWVAVGEGTVNTMAYSFDGITWVGLGKNVFTARATGIAWNGKGWVAAGQGGNTLAYSSNGIGWTGIGNKTFDLSGLVVTWAGTEWVSGGNGNGNTLAYSTDGLNWTGLGKTIFSTSCNTLACNNRREHTVVIPPNRIVATGTGTVNTLAYSNDGLTWTGLGKTVFITAGNSAEWNGRMWIAAGQGGNTLAYSSNGIQWTGLGVSVFSVSGITVAWNGSLWIAGGQGTNHTLAYSYDGTSWSGLSKTIFDTSCYSVAWNGSIWLAAGTNSSVGRIAYSTNGINWTNTGTTVFSTNAYNATWNGSLWVAGGSGTVNTRAYSYDGLSWTGLGLAPFTTSCLDVAWNGTMWVAVGNGATHTLAYSMDGITWVGLLKTIFSVYGNSVSWNGRFWTAVGSGATHTIAYSMNGITWVGQLRTIFDSTGNGVAWNKGLGAVNIQNITYMVGNSLSGGVNTSFSPDNVRVTPYYEHMVDTKVVAWDGNMWITNGYYSYDAINWKQNSLITQSFTAVATSGSAWVGGAANMLYYSADGLTWATTTGSSTVSIYLFVEWNGQIWIAGGTGSDRMVYSLDGKTWSVSNTASSTALAISANAAAWDGGKWMVAGSSTTMLAMSINGIDWSDVKYSGATFPGNSCLAWNGKQYLLGGSSGYAYSADGVTWTFRATPVIHEVSWNGQFWLAANNTNSGGVYSADGISWYNIITNSVSLDIVRSGLILNLDAATGITGSTWSDTSGYGKNYAFYTAGSGTWTGVPGTSTSSLISYNTTTVKGYKVAVFNGSSWQFAYNNVGLGTSLPAYTIEIWCQPTLASTDMCLINETDSTSINTAWNTPLVGLVGGYIRTGFYTGVNGSYAAYTSSINTYSVNTWYHIVATYSSGLLQLYVNGAFQSSVSATKANPTTFFFHIGSISPATTGTYYLGTLTAKNYFTGNIGAVNIYNTVLTYSQISQNYSALSPRYK